MHQTWLACLLQMLSFAQVSPDGRWIAAVSELGNVLVYEVGALTKDLHKVTNAQPEDRDPPSVFLLLTSHRMFTLKKTS